MDLEFLGSCGLGGQHVSLWILELLRLRCVSIPFMLGDPSRAHSWTTLPRLGRFDLADSTSADELGPMEVWVYLLRQHSCALLGNSLSHSPFLSFFLLLSGEE